MPVVIPCQFPLSTCPLHGGLLKTRIMWGVCGEVRKKLTRKVCFGANAQEKSQAAAFQEVQTSRDQSPWCCRASSSTSPSAWARAHWLRGARRTGSGVQTALCSWPTQTCCFRTSLRVAWEETDGRGGWLAASGLGLKCGADPPPATLVLSRELKYHSECLGAYTLMAGCRRTGVRCGDTSADTGS